MKKYLLFSVLGAVSLFTASCDEDFNDDVAAPQQWEQEEAVTLPEFTATGVSGLNLAEAPDSVIAFTPVIDVTQLPEGCTVEKFRVTLTAQKDNAVSDTLDASPEGKVLTADFQKLIEKDFGKRPVERTYDAVVSVDVMLGTQASLLQSKTVITAFPKAPFIDTKYYLIGDMCGWDASKILAFSHSDKDVYEDPVFSIMFTTTKDNSCWKIIPQTNVDAGNVWNEGETGVVGVAKDQDTSLEGKLVARAGVGAGKLEKTAIYRMTINMMDYTYKIVEVAPEYYLVGALQGWNSGAKTCMLYPQDPMHHSYTTKFENDANFKIWLGSEFGDWGKAMGTEVDGDQSPAGKIKVNGGAIKCPEPGSFYTVAIDFSANTYTWTKLDNQAPKEYAKIGLIGGFNGWGGDAFMTQTAPHNWYFEGLKIEADGDLKFRADADWKDDWGAKINVGDTNSGVCTYKGANITVPAGTYNVFFNDITCEFVFKKL